MVDESYLLKDGDQLALYHYKLTEFFIIIDGESTSFPIERIVSMSISNFYEKAVFPIFKLGVMMEPSRYYHLLKNKEKVKFKVRIQMYYTKNDNPENVSMMRDYINDTFVFFPTDDNPDQDKSIRTEDDLNSLDQLDNYVELFLFKEMVTKLRSPVNYVFNNVTLSTVVSYLLYKAGVKKVLMSPFENTQTYGQLVCPPLSTEAQIRYLNNNFGFYKKGGMLFFGFFHTYLLNCKEGCTAYAKKEWQESKIYILDKPNTKSSIGGTFIRPNEEIFYTLVQRSSIDFTNSAVVDNVLRGVDPTIVTMSSSSTSNNSSTVRGIAEKNKKIIFNDSSNPYMGETQLALQKANGMTIKAVIDNVNLEALNPNKKHTITFEDSQMNSVYGGAYRIADAVYNFVFSNGDFNIQAICTFKKL